MGSSYDRECGYCGAFLSSGKIKHDCFAAVNNSIQDDLQSRTCSEVTEEEISLKDGRTLILTRYSHTVVSEKFPNCLERIDDGSEFEIRG